MKRLNPRVLTVAIACVLAIGLTPRRALAQSNIKPFVHASFGVHVPAEKNYQQTFDDGFVEETDSYPAKTKVNVFVGGGAMFTPTIGAMVSFSRYSNSEVAHTAFAIPDFAFDDDVDTLDKFDRKETAVHIDACFVPQMAGMIDLMVFGGLTHFGVTQELIETYDINFNTNTIVTSSITKLPIKASAWGFNVGASITKPLNKNIGVGGMVRFSRGTVKLQDMLETLFNDDDGQTINMKVGGFEVSGGIVIMIK